jgi:hypothetical protein
MATTGKGQPTLGLHTPLGPPRVTVSETLSPRVGFGVSWSYFPTRADAETAARLIAAARELRQLVWHIEQSGYLDHPECQGSRDVARALLLRVDGVLARPLVEAINSEPDSIAE